MASTKVLEQPRPTLVAMTGMDMLRVFLVGLLIGIVLCALYVSLDHYVFTPALCEQATGTLERCENKTAYAGSIAMLLAAFGGLIAMVKLRMYRPLLVVISVTVSLWNIIEIAMSYPWWVGAIVLALLFGIAYAAFVWIARIRSFYVALLLSILLTVAVRIALMV